MSWRSRAKRVRSFSTARLGVLLLGAEQVDVAAHHRAQAEDRDRRRHDPERQAELAAPALDGAQRDRADGQERGRSAAATRSGSTITQATAM